MSIAPSRLIPTYPAPGESSDFEVTFEEFLAMPVTNQHVEVVDGVIQVMAGATFTHQEVVINFLIQLKSKIRIDGLGLLLIAPCDIIIRKRPKLRVRQPDLLYFSNARAGFDTAKDPARTQQANQDGILAPVLVVEVLSPGQNERTLADKLVDYASIRVQEVWFADQETKRIRILAFDGATYRLAGDFGPGEAVVSEVLPGISLDVSAVMGV